MQPIYKLIYRLYCILQTSELIEEAMGQQETYSFVMDLAKEWALKMPSSVTDTMFLDYSMEPSKLEEWSKLSFTMEEVAKLRLFLQDALTSLSEATVQEEAPEIISGPSTKTSEKKKTTATSTWFTLAPVTPRRTDVADVLDSGSSSLWDFNQSTPTGQAMKTGSAIQETFAYMYTQHHGEPKKSVLMVTPTDGQLTLNVKVSCYDADANRNRVLVDSAYPMQKDGDTHKWVKSHLEQIQKTMFLNPNSLVEKDLNQGYKVSAKRFRRQ